VPLNIWKLKCHTRKRPREVPSWRDLRWHEVHTSDIRHIVFKPVMMMPVFIRRTYTTNLLSELTHGVEPFLRSRQLHSYSKTSQHFTEPRASLPCSQEPSIGPYLEPD
jgi:hypothetical protein